MTINYLCIDDEPLIISEFLSTIEMNFENRLKFAVRFPKKFDEEIDGAINEQNSDGILLDLRLDRSSAEDGSRVRYRALSLAQELRTLMTEGKIKSVPIVIWSVETIFDNLYVKDFTGHDLFDQDFSKTKVSETHEEIAKSLISLAKGYKKISDVKQSKKRHIYKILLNIPDEFEILDPRIAGELAEVKSFPEHVYAKSILDNFVRQNGLTVDTPLLAARLGVDVSSPDFPRLLEKFASKSKYNGVFSEISERWWMHKIQMEWNTICPEHSLKRLNASARVEILCKKFRLRNLNPAQAIRSDYSTNYWHLCEVTKRPLASNDAVRLRDNFGKDWLDGLYTSLNAVLDREHIHKGYAIHPFEINRIKAIISGKKNEQKE